jgi:hypothetical protein
MPICPRKVQPPSKSKIESKISVSLIHGLKMQKDFCIYSNSPEWVVSDTNLQITNFLQVLLPAAAAEWEKNGVRPPTKLYWQSDRGSDMSNKTWLGFWQYLLDEGIFTEIIVSHMPVDHSHMDYDRLGAELLFFLFRNPGLGALSFFDLKSKLAQRYRVIDTTWDFNEWMSDCVHPLNGMKVQKTKTAL